MHVVLLGEDLGKAVRKDCGQCMLQGHYAREISEGCGRRCKQGGQNICNRQRFRSKELQQPPPMHIGVGLWVVRKGGPRHCIHSTADDYKQLSQKMSPKRTMHTILMRMRQAQNSIALTNHASVSTSYTLFEGFTLVQHTSPRTTVIIPHRLTVPAYCDLKRQIVCFAGALGIRQCSASDMLKS